MKKFSMFLSAAILVFLVSLSYSQSLGEIAEKEKQRRAEVKNDKVITDKETSKYWSHSETRESSADISESATKTEKPEDASKDPDQVEDVDPDEPVDFQGRTESYWRKTMSEARQKVKDLENESNALILKVNGLQDQFYKESDGYRRETIQRDLQKGYYEQDLNKENLEKAKALVQELEIEAHKSGALPGWIEDRTR